MAESQQQPNIIDIRKFFGGKSLYSAEVKVNKSQVLKTEPSFIGAPELASLLDVVATSVEDKNNYAEKIKSDEKSRYVEIEQQEKSNRRFQSILTSLNKDLKSLKTSYDEIIETLVNDRKLREKESREREDLLKKQSSEFSKERVGESLMLQTTAQSTESFTGQSEDQGDTGNVGLGKLLTAASGLGMLSIPSLLGFDDEDGGLESGSFPGGQYDATKLTQLARSAGFPEKNIPTAVAIALAESGGDPTIDTVKSGTDPTMKNEYSIGLWQINWLAHKNGTLKQMGVTNPDQLRDPATNAKAAVKLSGGSNFKPWTAYENGNYKSYMKEAQKAYEQSKPQSTKPKPAAPSSVNQQTSTNPNEVSTTSVASVDQKVQTQIKDDTSQPSQMQETKVAAKEKEIDSMTLKSPQQNATPPIIIAQSPQEKQTASQPSRNLSEDMSFFSSTNPDNLYMISSYRELNMA